MGRPTKLHEVGPKLVEALRSGLHVESACQFVGIAKNTYYEWLKRGEAGESGFAEFADSVKNAEVEAERAAIDVVRAHPPNWQALAWFLERRFPKRWGRRDPDYEVKRKAHELNVEKLTAEIAALKGGNADGVTADDAKVAELMREKFGGEGQVYDEGEPANVKESDPVSR